MSDLSESGPIDRWSRSGHPERRCTAHRKNGDRCKNAARLGTNVCDFHVAKAPQVKRERRASGSRKRRTDLHVSC